MILLIIYLSVFYIIFIFILIFIISCDIIKHNETQINQKGITMNIISVANQKGGVGKTTTSIEISAALAKENKKVLAIDFDQQCNLTKYVGLKSDFPTIDDVLHGEGKIEDAIRKLGLYDVIPASESLSSADRKFVDAQDIFLLSDVMDILKEQYDYDYVIIDNSPARNVLLNMSYIASDYVIVPTECDQGSLDGIMAIDTDIKKFRDGKHSFTRAKIMGFILTKYEKTIMHTESFKELEEIRDKIQPDAFILPVRKSIVVSESKVVKKSLQESERWSNPAIDYRAVAEEIIRRTE